MTGNGEHPPGSAPPHSRVHTDTSPRRRRAPGRWIGALLVLVGLAVAALAASINVQTGWRFGTTPEAAWTFAGLSVAADLLAVLLPPAAVALWARGCWASSGGAWAIWLVAASLATLASVGFASLHIADSAAARGAIVTTTNAAAERRSAAIGAARAAVDVAGKARAAECLKRGPRCRDLERDR